MKNYLIILAILTLSGCRTAKKEWVKENYQSKIEAVAMANELSNFTKTELTKINQSLILDFEEKLKQATQKTTQEESQSTTVSGTLTAEDGKEKSVTFGNTTIKSNGANVSFKTESRNSINKEYESNLKELHRQLDEERQFNQALNNEIISLKNQFANFASNQKTEKTTQTKEVNKKGWQTWVIVLAVFAGGIFAFSRWLDSRKSI